MREIITAAIGILMLAAAGATIVGLISPKRLTTAASEQPMSRRQIAAAGIGWLVIGAVGLFFAHPARHHAVSPKGGAQRFKTAATPEKVKMNFLLTFHSIENAETSCSDAAKAFADAAIHTDRYEVYERARDGANICRGAATEIRNIEIDVTISGRARKALSAAIENCADAETDRSFALDQAGGAVDGDLAPSAVYRARKSAELAEAGIAACTISLMKAATEAGVGLDELAGETG